MNIIIKENEIDEFMKVLGIKKIDENKYKGATVFLNDVKPNTDIYYETNNTQRFNNLTEHGYEEVEQIRFYNVYDNVELELDDIEIILSFINRIIKGD